ncbi:MAG: MucB/RseB C-terminal domain-containing protein [Rhodoferax sp.]
MGPFARCIARVHRGPARGLQVVIVAVLLGGLAGAWGVAAAQVATPSGDPTPVARASVQQWLMGLNQAARQQAYVGTFVVTAGSRMASSRIWHACDGRQQIERIDALNGEPRTTFRQDEQVLTLWPQSRVAVRERRDVLRLFPQIPGTAAPTLDAFYRLRELPEQRIAGLAVQGVELLPQDDWRFGYRVWTEPRSGVVVKLQTLGAGQSVLEQAAFSELDLGAQVSVPALAAQMAQIQGYRVRKAELSATTADQEGWLFKSLIPGFRLVGCHRRVDADQSALGPLMQCVLTDGLAAVSLFVVPFDAQRHGQMPRQHPYALGATQVVMRQLGPWWATAVGEVPEKTLKTLLQGLERTR